MTYHGYWLAWAIIWFLGTILGLLAAAAIDVIAQYLDVDSPWRRKDRKDYLTDGYEQGRLSGLQEARQAIETAYALHGAHLGAHAALAAVESLTEDAPELGITR